MCARIKNIQIRREEVILKQYRLSFLLQSRVINCGFILFVVVTELREKNIGSDGGGGGEKEKKIYFSSFVNSSVFPPATFQREVAWVKKWFCPIVFLPFSSSICTPFLRSILWKKGCTFVSLSTLAIERFSIPKLSGSRNKLILFQRWDKFIDLQSWLNKTILIRTLKRVAAATNLTNARVFWNWSRKVQTSQVRLFANRVSCGNVNREKFAIHLTANPIYQRRTKRYSSERGVWKYLHALREVPFLRNFPLSYFDGSQFDGQIESNRKRIIWKKISCNYVSRKLE